MKMICKCWHSRAAASSTLALMVRRGELLLSGDLLYVDAAIRSVAI